MRTPRSNGQRRQEIRTYLTTTSQVLMVVDWLAAEGVTVVAMESTGVCWKPVYDVLEDVRVLAAQRPARSWRTPGRPHRGRRGGRKAAVAVGHSILVIAYHLLDPDDPYSDLGADYFLRRDSRALLNRLVRQLEALGHTVTIDAAA